MPPTVAAPIVWLRMRNIAKILALLLLVVLAFAVNAYASSYFAAYLFPLVQPRPYSEMISAAVVGAISAGVVVAYPLVRLFPRRYWAAAVIVAIPVLELRGRDLLHYAGQNEPRIMVMSIVELLVYPAAILTCAWLASQWLWADSDVEENKID